MSQSAMDEIALVPTANDETAFTARPEEPAVHVVTSRTDSRKAKLAKKYQRTPLAFYQALALGALLLILILVCVAVETWRNTSRVSDGTKPHSQDDETYHLSIVEEARYNKFASRSEVTTGTVSDADTARMILKKFFDLDDQQLLQDTEKHIEGLWRCQGTHWALSAFTYWKEHGIVSGGAFGSHEGCRPYTFEPSCGAPCGSSLYRKDRTPRCERQCQELYHKTYDQDLVQARKAYWLRAINGSAEYTPVVKSTLQRLINVFAMFSDLRVDHRERRVWSRRGLGPIDAEGVIDRMLAETRWATKSETSASEEGLALYVDRDGAASIDPQGAGFQKVTLADTSS
ncbi:hypothetical protein ANCDUO_08776 [Ancylostoma duodenale]|uniref:Uncharacterized protein n=1 Tax=Ancylostoma duodenale TaxID=51022 RepID=A0A0C2CVP5_9BILA|nr:hypothetical protein ANCDUO_08776 [Ancylostoma duodenale]